MMKNRDDGSACLMQPSHSMPQHTTPRHAILRHAIGRQLTVDLHPIRRHTRALSLKLWLDILPQLVPAPPLLQMSIRTVVKCNNAANPAQKK